MLIEFSIVHITKREFIVNIGISIKIVCGIVIGSQCMDIVKRQAARSNARQYWQGGLSILNVFGNGSDWYAYVYSKEVSWTIGRARGFGS